MTAGGVQVRRLPAALTAAALAIALVAAPAAAQDIREAARKAAQEKAAAEQEAAQSRERILADRQALQAEVRRLENERRALQQQTDELQASLDAGRKLQEDLARRWAERELGVREISGNVRTAARDLQSLLQASPLSAGAEWRLRTIGPLLDTGYFPGIDDISAMAGVFCDEIARGGQVTRRQGEFVGRDGRPAEGTIFQIGKFTSVYRRAGETGFLTWTPGGERLFALPEPPPRGVRRALDAYLDGRSDDVPVDISGGATLRQLTRRQDFGEQMRAGGPIMWPLGLIAAAALLIAAYKIVYLNRLHGKTDSIMNRVTELAERGDWAGCEALLAEHAGRNWPVVQVARAGLAARDRDRPTLETVLQEAILHELPRIQKGIAIFAVLGAVAPLLGLLGTVTGMIETFRVITIFGNSDPKLMSGGISEALITTEVGLMIAIPIMLLHTYIARRSDHLIGDMEEKAVQLTNIIQTRAALAGGSGATGALP